MFFNIIECENSNDFIAKDSSEIREKKINKIKKFLWCLTDKKIKCSFLFSLLETTFTYTYLPYMLIIIKIE